MLGSFNNFNIIQLTNKTTSSEYFNALHKVVIGVISDNMVYLIQLDKCGAINALVPTTVGYYLIRCLYKPYTLQKDQNKDGQVNKSFEPVFKYEYLSLMKAKQIGIGNIMEQIRAS